MNGVPMKFDYSKTINEQLPTFDYYKDRYCSYELELINDRKEIERLNNIIDKLEIDIEDGAVKYTYDTDYNRGLSDAFIYMKDKIKELKGSISNEQQ